MLLSEHVYCVAITFKMTEWVEQWICNALCIKLERSSEEIVRSSEGRSRGQLVMSTFITVVLPFTHHVSCSFLAKHQSPRRLSPLQPRFGALWLRGFPKTKITFGREEISDCWWDSRKYDGAYDGDSENCVRSQGAYVEGDWDVVVLLQCFLYLVSSSINVSSFHITWLDTFWTDLV